MSVCVWRPVISSWEKKIGLKGGLFFAWTKFLEAKECAESSQSIHAKIFDWDDSAGKETFHNAKNRFYARKNGLSYPNPVPNPDMYMVEIDWDAKVDPELQYSRSVSNTDEDEDDAKAKILDWYHISIEDIKPTGWDIDMSHTSSFPIIFNCCL